MWARDVVSVVDSADAYNIVKTVSAFDLVEPFFRANAVKAV